MRKNIALLVLWLFGLAACKDCYLLCYNPMEIQIGYVDIRDDCQDMSEQRVTDFLSREEQAADPRSRNTVLLAIFSKCMQSAGWGVSSPKMDGVIEKYGEARFAALLPKKKKEDDKDGKKGGGEGVPQKEPKRLAPSRESGLETGPQDPRFQQNDGRGGASNQRSPAVPYWQEPPIEQAPPKPVAPDRVTYPPSALGVGPMSNMK